MIVFSAAVVVNACPKKCLTMEKGYTEPDTVKNWETFTRPVQETAAKAGGKPAMDPEKMRGTVHCVQKNAPQSAITVDRQAKTWKLDDEKCVGCGICASSCPKKAIEMKG